MCASDCGVAVGGVAAVRQVAGKSGEGGSCTGASTGHGRGGSISSELRICTVCEDIWATYLRSFLGLAGTWVGGREAGVGGAVA
mmetsp:Transcript_42559/g.108940  ORF Transcript_42559/g.108940 Transcript_42559/m.108940 type:complete len:84 (+) Transcript_42559:478-729(+)